MQQDRRNRYVRQTMFPGLGEEGQQKLEKGSIVVVGCGALGCNIANLLVRAGVGKVRIIDRDFVEYHNLQRQVLFNENDVKSRLPKAVAARKTLQAVNHFVDIEAIVADVNPYNAETYCSGMNIILDGLDNIETRFLLNDVSLKLKIPYIYGGAVASTGMTMTLVPGKTPCFRCVFPGLPPPRTLPTCETAGILGSTPAIIGALQATEAIKLLTGAEEVNHDLITLDVWELRFDRLKVKKRDDCPACAGKYEYLEKKPGIVTASLCGQSRAIQVTTPGIEGFDLHQLAMRLQVRNLFQNEYLVRFNVQEYEVTVFHDGRAIINNTLDEAEALAIYQNYVLNTLQL